MKKKRLTWHSLEKFIKKIYKKRDNIKHWSRGKLKCNSYNSWSHLKLSLKCNSYNSWSHLKLSLKCNSYNSWSHLKLSLKCNSYNSWSHLKLSLKCNSYNSWSHLKLSLKQSSKLTIISDYLLFDSVDIDGLGHRL